jgi:anti-sigma factor RsiW
MSGEERMPSTHDCGSDAAAYALGALEPAEAEQFRAHMDTCVVCRDEVMAFQQVAEALPMAAPQQPVPRACSGRSMRRRGPLREQRHPDDAS